MSILTLRRKRVGESKKRKEGKFPNQRVGESKKEKEKKENSQIKEWEEEEEKCFIDTQMLKKIKRTK